MLFINVIVLADKRIFIMECSFS